MLGVHRKTVALDIQMESARRAYDNAPSRMENQTLSLARLEAVIARANKRIDLLDEVRQANAPSPAGQDADKADPLEKRRALTWIQALSEANRTEHVILEAQKQINKLLGLTEPLPMGAAPPPADTRAIVRILLSNMTPDQQIAAMRAASERARELGVLPAPRHYN
jgi:hypothetical protein